MAPPEPTAPILGDYELLTEIGRGATGVVYLARQLSLGRLVALKMLPTDLAGDEIALARFRREVRASAACDHPNIVKVLSSGQMPDGQFYYTMEYVPGSDLENIWQELAHEDGMTEISRLGASSFMWAVLSASGKRRQQAQTRFSRSSRADASRDMESVAASTAPAPLAEYLQLYLDGKPLPIRPPSTAEMVRRWMRGHRPLVAAVAAVIIIAVSVAFVMIARARDEAIVARNEAVAARDREHTARTDAEQQHSRAEKEARSAEEQTRIATQQTRIANKNLAEALVEKGVPLFKERSFLSSYIWGAKALTLDPASARARSLAYLSRVSAPYLLKTSMLGHEGWVMSVAFSPDGRTLASASDETIWLWPRLDFLYLDPEAVYRQAQLDTGLRIEGSAVRALSPEEWRALKPMGAD